MQEELRRSNSIGTANGINYFLDVVFIKKTVGIDALHHAFRYHSLMQFNCHLALLFFEELGLIESYPKEIRLTEKGISLSKLSPKGQKERLSVLVFKRLFQEDLIDYERFYVDPITGELRIPINAFALSAAIYRNFLYEMGCFLKHGHYFSIANEKLREQFEEEAACKRKKVSQAELLLKLQKQQEDGEIGEQIVLEFEKRRLDQRQQLPKWISPIDVSAGYDILSYHSMESNSYDRYIEVKSFRGIPHFYWSANEKRVAELFGDNYVLYLVDLSAVEKEGTSYVPQMIPNPALNLKCENWLIETNSYYITFLK